MDPAKPDIILIVSDDININIMNQSSCPHIKGLMNQGLSFSQAYNYGGSTGAVCKSSRLQMLYGKPWDRMNTARDPFPKILRDHGYETFATGKWHSGQGLFDDCFSHWESVFFGGMMNGKSTISKPSNGEASQLGLRKPGGVFSQSLIKYIRSKKQDDSPYFAYIGFTEPHDPLREIKPFSQVNQARLPANFKPDHPFSFGYRKHRDEKLMKRPLQKKVLLRRIHKYMTMISYLDKCVGNILESITRPTIVIFTTDNGLNMGSHGLLGKQNLYQESIHVPLSISSMMGAKLGGGGASNRLVYLHDLYKTVIQLANISPDRLNGNDYSLLEQNTSREFIKCRFKSEQYAIIHNNFKLIYYSNINKYQLFDLEKDPLEMNPLSISKHQDIVNSLLAYLDLKMK